MTVLYTFHGSRKDNIPGVPARDITEADWETIGGYARSSIKASPLYSKAVVDAAPLESLEVEADPVEAGEVADEAADEPAEEIEIGDLGDVPSKGRRRKSDHRVSEFDMS